MPSDDICGQHVAHHLKTTCCGWVLPCTAVHAAQLQHTAGGTQPTAHLEVVQHLAGLGARLTAAQHGGGQAGGQVIQLVPHQRQQRRHHQHRAAAHHRRQLVAQRLARTCMTIAHSNQLYLPAKLAGACRQLVAQRLARACCKWKDRSRVSSIHPVASSLTCLLSHFSPLRALVSFWWELAPR